MILGALAGFGILSIDCDTLYNTGIYQVASANATTLYHTPSNYGVLVIFSPAKDNASYYIQVFIERTATNFRVLIRTGNKAGGYYPWRRLATTTDI